MIELSDPVFPGLKTALNPDDMVQLLRQAFKQSHKNLEVRSAKIWDVKYEPGNEVVLLYQFKLRDRSTRLHHNHFFSATLLKENEHSRSAVEWADLLRYAPQEPFLIRNPFFYFEAPKIVLNAFPYDPVMPWLCNFMNEKFLVERLNLSWSHPSLQIERIKTSLLGYTPGLRAVFLYKVHLSEKTSGNERTMEWIGKTSSYKVPELVFADLWGLSNTCEGKIGIPKPVTYFGEPPLTLHERVPGERLGNLVHSSSFPRLLRETARSIAVVHQTRIPLNKLRDPVRETYSLKRWGSILKNLRSDLSGRIEKLLNSLLHEIQTRTAVTGTVHGDFHPSNVLVDGEKVFFIDFDQMAYGDPSCDIGRFLASFRISSLRDFGDLSSLAEARETFLEEYLKEGSANAGNIRMFESAALMTKAASAFRVQKPGWEKQALLLLEEAERVFETAQPRSSSAVAPFNSHALQVEEKKRWMLDPIYMRAALGLPLRRDQHVEVLSTTILQSKQSGSAYRALFRVQGKKNDAPWSCELEGILLKRRRRRAMFNQLVALHEIALHRKDAFLIPTPIAYLSLIGTIVQAPFSGRRFSFLSGKGDVVAVTSKLARAIQILHESKIPCHQELLTQQLCERVECQISQLSTRDPDLYGIAAKIFEQIVQRIPHRLEENSVAIHRLAPENVVFVRGRFGLARMKKIVRAHPCLDIGGFLASLMLQGLQGRNKAASEVAEHLRAAYINLEGEKAQLLPVFEALALLRLAYVCKDDRRIANQLLSLASAASPIH